MICAGNVIDDSGVSQSNILLIGDSDAIQASIYTIIDKPHYMHLNMYA